MTPDGTSPAPNCRHGIEIGYRCYNHTRHESGLCPRHRKVRHPERIGVAMSTTREAAERLRAESLSSAAMPLPGTPEWLGFWRDLDLVVAAVLTDESNGSA